MRTIFLLLLIACVGYHGFGQSRPEVDDLLLDFSVPDMPAFKA